MIDQITIHYAPQIEWQARRVKYFAEGLEQLGIRVLATSSQERISQDPVILFGTTRWRRIEAVPGRWLLVDRASYFDPDYVSLKWNGHHLHGDHKIPKDWQDRPKREIPELKSPRESGTKIVLCGQTELYCDLYPNLHEWYRSALDQYHWTDFRPHPTERAKPGGVPVWSTWDDVKLAITLNSSVAIDAMIRGVPVRAVDPYAMSHLCGGLADREHLFQKLAWTQWSWEEIKRGEPIAHLFD